MRSHARPIDVNPSQILHYPPFVRCDELGNLKGFAESERETLIRRHVDQDHVIDRVATLDKIGTHNVDHPVRCLSARLADEHVLDD